MSMSKEEQYQWKKALLHIEQVEHHKKVANALIDGLCEKYYSDDYQQESLTNLRQALN